MVEMLKYSKGKIPSGRVTAAHCFLTPVRAVVDTLRLFMYMESISLISPRLISTGLKSSAESSESVLA